MTLGRTRRSLLRSRSGNRGDRPRIPEELSTPIFTLRGSIGPTMMTGHAAFRNPSMGLTEARADYSMPIRRGERRQNGHLPHAVRAFTGRAFLALPERKAEWRGPAAPSPPKSD